RIEPERAVVVVGGTSRKISTQLGEARFALVENRSAEERQAFYIQRHFRQTFRCLEEIVRLEPPDRGQRVVRICFRDRDDVVRLRIQLKLALEKILEDEFVAELGDVRDAGD